MLCTRDDFKPIGYSCNILKETLGTRNRKATIFETNTVWVAMTATPGVIVKASYNVIDNLRDRAGGLCGGFSPLP